MVNNDNLEEKVGPDDVEDLQQAQQPVKDVVGREHRREADGVKQGWTQDPAGVDTAPAEEGNQ